MEKKKKTKEVPTTTTKKKEQEQEENLKNTRIIELNNPFAEIHIYIKGESCK